jgi:hypothetical protein
VPLAFVLIRGGLAAAAFAFGPSGVAPHAGATAGAPKISALGVSNVTDKSASITASIDPNGETTKYELRLEWEPTCSPACELANEERVIRHGTVRSKSGAKSFTVHTRLPIQEWRYMVYATATNESGTTTKRTSFRSG